MDVASSFNVAATNRSEQKRSCPSPGVHSDVQKDAYGRNATRLKMTTRKEVVLSCSSCICESSPTWTVVVDRSTSPRSLTEPARQYMVDDEPAIP